MFNKEKKNYFIIIGCNYNGKLSGCINDAYSMYNTFSNIPNEEIYLLTDNKEKINKKIIENKIQSIHKKENKNSNSLYQIILTFSGHGEPNGILKLSENDLSRINSIKDELKQFTNERTLENTKDLEFMKENTDM